MTMEDVGRHYEPNRAAQTAFDTAATIEPSRYLTLLALMTSPLLGHSLYDATLESALYGTSSRPLDARHVLDTIDAMKLSRSGLQQIVGDCWGLVLHSEAPQSTDPDSPAIGKRTLLALNAVADLSNWLQVKEHHVADMAHFSRRSITNWRVGKNPYPATVRELFEVHALVASVVRELGGPDKARAWLSGSVDGVRRAEGLRSAQGRRRLIREVQSMLFERAPVSAPLLDLGQETLEDRSSLPARPKQFKEDVPQRKRSRNRDR